MALLTRSDLAHLRSNAETALADRVTISRVTEVPDGFGGITEVWADVGNVPGMVTTEPGGERAVAEVTSGEFIYRVRLPAGTDVVIKDRLVIQGRTLEVLGVAVPKTYEVLRAVRAVEVR